MRYLITCNTHKPFVTHFFNPEEQFTNGIDMIVYDLLYNRFTIDGLSWEILEEKI
jgi:hypothetical protein